MNYPLQQQATPLSFSQKRQPKNFGKETISFAKMEKMEVTMTVVLQQILLKIMLKLNSPLHDRKNLHLPLPIITKIRWRTYYIYIYKLGKINFYFVLSIILYGLQLSTTSCIYYHTHTHIHHIYINSSMYVYTIH